MANEESYLKAILTLMGHQAFTVPQVAEIVGVGKTKQIEAFNACDGSRTQGEIAKSLSLDRGNFSRTVARWVEAGIMFRIAEGTDARLLHVFPIPSRFKKLGKETESGE